MPKLTLDRYIQIAMGLMVLLLVAAIYFPLHETLVQVGDRAPDFSIKADNGSVTANIGGEGTLPPMTVLLSDLKAQGASATITVEVVPAQTYTGTTNP